MARIRTIKPEYFKHLKLFELEEETGLPLRVAFAALWTVADREGRFVWIPRQLKIDCLPYDEIDFSRVLNALTTREFVIKYAVEGVEYGYIPSFLDHQVINNKERASKLPDPTDDAALTCDPRDDDALTTRDVRKGKEGKGKEQDKNPTSKKYIFDEDHLEASNWMAGRVKAIAPKQKDPNLEAWAHTIRLMNHKDDLDMGEICQVFDWANKDSFWKTNILSPEKLREKFGEFHTKMNEGDKPKYSTKQQNNIDVLTDFLDGDDGTDFSEGDQ